MEVSPDGRAGNWNAEMSDMVALEVTVDGETDAVNETLSISRRVEPLRIMGAARGRAKYCSRLSATPPGVPRGEKRRTLIPRSSRRASMEENGEVLSDCDD